MVDQNFLALGLYPQAHDVNERKIANTFVLFKASRVISALYLIRTEKQLTIFTGRIHSFSSLFQALSQ